jgi:hypothetical protein
MTVWNYLYGFPIHFLRIAPILYSKKLIKYLKLRLSEVYVSFGKYQIWLFDCGLRSGRERQFVNIRFQLCWNLILLFVIVGLDPTIQKISDSLKILIQSIPDQEMKRDPSGEGWMILIRWVSPTLGLLSITASFKRVPGCRM